MRVWDRLLDGLEHRLHPHVSPAGRHAQGGRVLLTQHGLRLTIFFGTSFSGMVAPWQNSW